MKTQNADQNRVEQKQVLRKRRHAMAFATYLVPVSLVVLCWSQGLLPEKVIYHVAAAVLLINITILMLIHTNLNLKFRDPSMTAAHIAVSSIPTLYVMYFLEHGHARSIFMIILVVAMIYGILELNTRRFLMACLWIFSLYCIMLLALWHKKPESLDWSLELIQMAAFFLTLLSMSIVGGYISNLREKLRSRNQELQKAIEKINILVSIDPLTEVSNRRRLFEVLTQETNRCSRGETPFSICLLDIDHFKQVNDTYGHMAGDEILCNIASSISEDIRNIDAFGRYGGEEFLLVLPRTPIAGAGVKAEKVRSQVAGLRFPDISEDLSVTVSIGVAQYRPPEDIDATLLRADRALYAAKESGRNRVETEKNHTAVA
ncbi:MAG: diguanylate cyclase [Desulfosalsimonas sp.]|uniref:GGDEF domain-containing protein n=1 Tax=Desulfosalsimonas sp. TaxID=3073848 RepID=UPI003970CD31